jgi:hypothetical protein
LIEGLVREDTSMHAVIRHYSGNGAKEFVDLIEKRKDEVRGIITGIKGFVRYTFIRTTDGGYTVSVYQDKAGADESLRKAKDWIQQNASHTDVSPPKISEGSVVLHA